MRIPVAAAILLLAGCAPETDDELKRRAADACKIRPEQIGTWIVSRDQKGEVSQIASLVDEPPNGNTCVEKWKDRQGIQGGYVHTMY